MTVETTAAAGLPDILELAEQNGPPTLLAAITAAGLDEVLSGEGPFTIFVPSEIAFDELPAGVLDKLLLEENKDVLVKILTYHVIGDQVMSTDLAPGDVVTVEGSTLAVTTEGNLKVNGVNVHSRDLVGSNGVLHFIDKVLVPPTVDLASL